MDHFVQPSLDVHFKPANDATTAIVTSLYEQLDHRLKAVKNWKACHAVICGILALRWAESFKVTRANLSLAHKEAFDAIAESLTGTLIQRAGGRNVYRIHPHFVTGTTVMDTRPADYRFRVKGKGVSFASNASIQSPEAVALLGHNHSASLTLSEVGHVVEYQFRGIDLPENYFTSLEPVELSQDAIEIASQYRTYIAGVMARFGYIGVPVHGLDENHFHFAVLDLYAHEFPEWLYKVSLPFWRTQKLSDGRSLKAVVFPATIKRKDGRTQVVNGQSVQTVLERMAGTT